jgi:hypothetical protein
MLVSKEKYYSSILFVAVLGAVLQLIISQSTIRDLTLHQDGLVHIWEFTASGGGLAGLYVFLFEKWLWKIPLLQRWFIRFPNLHGTWVGVLTPQTKAMQEAALQKDTKAAASTYDWAGKEDALPVHLTIGMHGTWVGSLELQADAPQDLQRAAEPAAKTDWWQAEGVLPVQLTIDHKFDGIVYTAQHPNSTNATRAAQIADSDTTNETYLYVAYHNEPDDKNMKNAYPHDGCCKLKLVNHGDTLSATTKWLLKGEYWTNKQRSDNCKGDRGTWGYFEVQWKSRKSKNPEIDWQKRDNFILDKSKTQS